jgi:hypothetical protein
MNKPRKKSARSFQLAACFQVSCLAYSLSLEMEAVRSSETPVDFYRTTRPYTPEDNIFIVIAVRTLNYTGITEFLGFVHRPMF